MALPSAAPERTLHHRRSIDVEVYARGNGLWEVDATVRDVRSHDAHYVGGLLPAGQPIHHMLLRLVVDEQFNIVEAGAETYAMPYAGVCERHGDAYAQLAGLNLMRQFRQALKERVGGALACTHITELAQVLPTAVVQAFAGTVVDTRGDDASARRPFQIDRCHALRADGEVVRRLYPRWFRQHAVSSAADTAPPVAAAPSSPDLSQETSSS